MNKPPIFLTFVICLLGFASWAQTKPNKIDNAMNKADNSLSSNNSVITGKAAFAIKNTKTPKADNSITITGL